ncbi:hypothetical protein M9458_038287, partial [Cirrhinus mrigala]
RKGPGKGRSPEAALAPCRGPRREGRWLLLAALSTLATALSGAGKSARHPGPRP